MKKLTHTEQSREELLKIAEAIGLPTKSILLGSIELEGHVLSTTELLGEDKKGRVNRTYRLHPVELTGEEPI